LSAMPCTMADETARNALKTVAVEPARARDNAIDVQNQPIPDLIALDKHLNRANVAKAPHRAVLRVPGAFGTPGGAV